MRAGISDELSPVQTVAKARASVGASVTPGGLSLTRGQVETLGVLDPTGHPGGDAFNLAYGAMAVSSPSVAFFSAQGSMELQDLGVGRSEPLLFDILTTAWQGSDFGSASLQLRFNTESMDWEFDDLSAFEAFAAAPLQFGSLNPDGNFFSLVFSYAGSGDSTLGFDYRLTAIPLPPAGALLLGVVLALLGAKRKRRALAG